MRIGSNVKNEIVRGKVKVRENVGFENGQRADFEFERLSRKKQRLGRNKLFKKVAEIKCLTMAQLGIEITPIPRNIRFESMCDG